MAANDDDSKAATGIAGLDEVLRGGFPANRVYLIQGDPGSGKTTLGLQFLLEGERTGEVGMYVSLSETRPEISAVARSHGWSLDGIRLFEMQEVAPQLSDEAENTLFEPSEVELREIMDRLLARDRRVQGQQGGVRLAVGAAAPGPASAPLPASDPDAQAVLRRAAVHRALPRRSDGARGRPPAAEHRPRRDHARAARLRVRQRAAAAPGGEGSGPPSARRLSRADDRQGRAAGLPAPGGLGAADEVRSDGPAERRSRSGRPPRRRRRSGDGDA